MASKLATFGGGCFWCVEACMQRVPGVLGCVSGYAGGTTKDPTYKKVCSGASDHAEVVQVTYNSQKALYGDLLKAFFLCHDPTQLNRQGNDVGIQYRSV